MNVTKITKVTVECNIIIILYNFDDVVKEDTKEHNTNWPEVLIIHTEY